MLNYFKLTFLGESYIIVVSLSYDSCFSFKNSIEHTDLNLCHNWTKLGLAFSGYSKFVELEEVIL